MTDYALFLGSFHPVLVHLPIGVLLGAFTVQLLSFLPRFGGLQRATTLLYGLAALGGVLAVGTGWALAGPTGAVWDTHRWFGLGALALGVATTAYLWKQPHRSVTGISLGLATVLVTGWAGHLGGTLTHGEGHFTQYAPAAFKPEIKSRSVALRNPDSIIVYTALIQPMLDEHCVACHRAELAHGQLRLDSYAALLQGGKEGDAISSGTEGELWKRVSLSPAHARFMPTRGVPLGYDQLQIVRAWLAAEKDSMLTVKAWAPDAATLAAIARSYHLDLRPLPYVERARPAAVALDDIPFGWEIQALSAAHTTLMVRCSNSEAELSALTPFAQNITQLDLRKIGSTTAWTGIPAMPHLTRLDLTGTSFGDASIPILKQYPHLEVLNLTGTGVSDVGLRSLGELPALRQLYIYGSAISAEGLRAFQAAHENIEVPGRFTFAELSNE